MGPCYDLMTLAVARRFYLPPFRPRVVCGRTKFKLRLMSMQKVSRRATLSGNVWVWWPVAAFQCGPRRGPAGFHRRDWHRIKHVSLQKRHWRARPEQRPISCPETAITSIPVTFQLWREPSSAAQLIRAHLTRELFFTPGNTTRTPSSPIIERFCCSSPNGANIVANAFYSEPARLFREQPRRQHTKRKTSAGGLSVHDISSLSK